MADVLITLRLNTTAFTEAIERMRAAFIGLTKSMAGRRYWVTGNIWPLHAFTPDFDLRCTKCPHTPEEH